MGGRLSALFGALLVGCGPRVTEQEGGGSESGGSTTGGTTGASASTTATTSTATSTTTTGTTTSTTDPTADTSSDTGTFIQAPDFGCEPMVVDEVFDLPLSVISPYLDDQGQLPPQACNYVCSMLIGVQGRVLSCNVEDGGGSSSDGTTTSDGSSSSTTGEPTVPVHCEWVDQRCIGRRHAALRSDGRVATEDPFAAWLARAAHAEAASVFAFLALHDELAAHGAPQDLRDRTIAAARDELAHARTMARIARHHGASVATPRFARIASRDLEAIAIENAIEGCVRETWNALEATLQARDAEDPELRSAMQRIAIDETRHAELALDLAAWLDTQLQANARARVHDARRAAIAGLHAELSTPHPDPLYRRAGLPTPATAQHLLEGLRVAAWA
jgi:hypothetical protein